MGFLKTLYPRALQLEKKVTKPFVIKLVVFVVIGMICSVLLSIPGTVLALLNFTTGAKIAGAICGAIGSLVGLYLTGGIVVSILKFTGVIKDEAVNNATVPNNAFTNAAEKVGSVFGKVDDVATGAANKVADKVTEDKDDKKDEE